MKLPDGFTRADLIACAERELRLRERVYPRQVQLARMSANKSRDEIAAMRAILAVLRQLPEEAPAQAGLFGAGRDGP